MLILPRVALARGEARETLRLVQVEAHRRPAHRLGRRLLALRGDESRRLGRRLGLRRGDEVGQARRRRSRRRPTAHRRRRRVAQLRHPPGAEELRAARALQIAQLAQQARRRVGEHEAVDLRRVVDERRDGGVELALLGCGGMPCASCTSPSCHSRAAPRERAAFAAAFGRPIFSQVQSAGSSPCKACCSAHHDSSYRSATPTNSRRARAASAAAASGSRSASSASVWAPGVARGLARAAQRREIAALHVVRVVALVAVEARRGVAQPLGEVLLAERAAVAPVDPGHRHRLVLSLSVCLPLLVEAALGVLRDNVLARAAREGEREVGGREQRQAILAHVAVEMRAVAGHVRAAVRIQRPRARREQLLAQRVDRGLRDVHHDGRAAARRRVRVRIGLRCGGLRLGQERPLLLPAPPCVRRVIESMIRDCEHGVLEGGGHRRAQRAQGAQERRAHLQRVANKLPYSDRKFPHDTMLASARPPAVRRRLGSAVARRSAARPS